MADLQAISTWKWNLEPDDFNERFLVPALTGARRYDRLAGPLSTAGLLVSTRGIEHLLQEVPRESWPVFRLLVCEPLAEEDVRVIPEGLEARRAGERLAPRMAAALEAPGEEGASARPRVELLAALLAMGWLEIRVALPRRPDGRLLTGAVEHARMAIVHDHEGNALVGYGSVNETWHGWRQPTEQMDLFASWEEPVWSRYGQTKMERFERMWEERDPQVLVIDLPRTVREQLISFAPAQLPAQFQPAPVEQGGLWTPEELSVLLRFIQDAPRLPGAGHLGLATAGVQPWPHQAAIADVAAAEDRPRFLLGDEEGLGKTAEVAFAIRQRILDGRDRRVLILAPGNLLPGWQQELREKGNLYVPLYTGSELVWPSEDATVPPVRTPVPPGEAFLGERCLILAASDLMRREERHREILHAPEWDLVVVDEAHQARRQGYRRPYEAPNRLLALLGQLSTRTRGLLLLTATPLAIDPRELWDLLRLLGISSPFQNSYDDFRCFYQGLARCEEPASELREPFELAFAARVTDPDLLARVEAEHPLLAQRFRSALSSPRTRADLRGLSRLERSVARRFLLAYAPTRATVVRTTRGSLGKSRDEGRLAVGFPRREVQTVTVAMGEAEETAFRQLEEHLAGQYAVARNGNQQGLGFVLTAYRQRLASSMFALAAGLGRRLADLPRDAVPIRSWLDPHEDLGDARELGDENEERLLEEGVVKGAEAAGIAELLAAIPAPDADSKFQRLLQMLAELLAIHPRLVLFTASKDTLEYLRQRLVREVTPQVGCYSEGGGEVYDPGVRRFLPASRDDIQAALERDAIRILLCTDAAPDELNLTACGALVNYDLPWNPLRLKRRISRIDRLGQPRPLVRIRTLLHAGTAEEEVHRALAASGHPLPDFPISLQPLLATVPKTIQTIAMAAGDLREQVGQEALGALAAVAKRLEQAAGEVPLADENLRSVRFRETVPSPVRLEDLRRVFLHSRLLLEDHLLHDRRDDTFDIRWQDHLLRITWSRRAMERSGETCRLFSYGDPAFDSLVAAVSCPPDLLTTSGLTREEDAAGTVRYFHGSREVATLQDLLAILGGSGPS